MVSSAKPLNGSKVEFTYPLSPLPVARLTGREQMALSFVNAPQNCSKITAIILSLNVAIAMSTPAVSLESSLAGCESFQSPYPATDSDEGG